MHKYTTKILKNKMIKKNSFIIIICLGKETNLYTVDFLFGK
jgi:hypothetical protein